MAARRPDTIRIESSTGSFDRFNSLTITNDITAPSEAIFDIGDDGSWNGVSPVIGHGRPFKIFLNDRLRMAGRVEAQDSPTTAGGGTTIQCVLRTKIADARYRSADPKTRVENVSIAQFVYALYAALGYTPADFVFAANLERDLMTGVGSRGAKPPVTLDPIKADQAKVNPPETIFDAAARHLKRHGLMHWDTPDGKIFVGAPDDAQLPIYRLQMRRGIFGAGNNLLSARRILDWSDAPSEVEVYGYSGGGETERVPIKAVSLNQQVIDAGFNRLVIIKDEQQPRTLAQLEAQARRERAARSKRIDAFELVVDGWSYWDGQKSIPFGVNTTVDLLVDTVGGPQGRYYVQKVSCSLDTQGAQKTSLSVVAPGTWEL